MLNNLFGWAVSNALRDGLLAVARGGQRLDKIVATDLLRLLGEEAVLYTNHELGEVFCKKNFPTNRHGGRWSTGKPTGVVDHYTAAPNIGGTLRWFSREERPPNSGNSSSHYVIGTDGVAIQLVDPLTTVAWHATIANQDHIGIEHVNCGLLTPKDGGYLFMGSLRYTVDMGRPPEEMPYVSPWVKPEDRGIVKPSEKLGWWEPFSAAQIVSNIVLKRLFLAAMPSIKPIGFVQHRDIDPSGKVDCGPMWPDKEINLLACSDSNLTSMTWAQLRYLDKNALSQMSKEVKNLLDIPTDAARIDATVDPRPALKSEDEIVPGVPGENTGD